MKTIKKTTYQIPLKQGGPPATTVDLIRNCLDLPPQGGFTLQVLRDRDRIEKALDQSKAKIKKEITFEDQDWKNLKAIVKQSTWGTRHPDILAFLEEFE